MISRRTLAVVLAKAAGLSSLAAGSRASAEEESPSETFFAGCFKDFDRFVIPPSVRLVVTTGYWKDGVGAAEYVSIAPGKPSRYRARSANGRWFELATDQLYVEKFGALGNDPNFDDYPAIQAAIDYIEQRGGGVIRCEGAKTYHLSETVKLNPTLTSIDAEGATWAFSQHLLRRPSNPDTLLVNGDFAAAGANWLLGKRPGTANWTFATGKAVFEPQPGAVPARRGDFGQVLRGLQPREHVSLSLVLDSVGAAEAEGHVFVGLCDGIGGPPDNGIGFGAEAGRTFTKPGTYRFSVRVPATVKKGAPAWFEVRATGGARISKIALRREPNNVCVQVSATAGSTQYGQTRRYCRGLRIVGPPAMPNLADGLLFETEVGASSSRWALYSCEFAVNLGRALVLSDRAYLLQAYSSRFSGAVAGLETLTNLIDAGESVDFFGCTFDNGGIGVSNPGGMEIKLFGGAIDYCQQFYAGNGQVTLFGTHLEMAQPRTAGQYPIELTGPGDFKMKEGTILVTPQGANDYMFFGADRFSRVLLEDVDGYGWPAAKGQLMGGQGRLLIEGIWWGPNHQMAPVVKRDALHSVFGAGGQFAGPAIALGCAVTSPSGKNEGPHLSRFLGGGIEFSAQLMVSDERAHSGTHSLKFIKKGWGSGSETPVFLFAPAERRRMISCEFWYSYSRPPAARGKSTLWMDLVFAQILGFDNEHVPLVAQTALCQEMAVAVDFDQDSGWSRALLSSTYADATSATDGYAPDWTTHMLISINPVNMPSDFALYIDDLYGFSF